MDANEKQALERWQQSVSPYHDLGTEIRPRWQKRMTPQERYAAYCDGINAVTSQLSKAGCTVINNDGSSSALQHKGIILDFRLQDPSKVAHVCGVASDDPGRRSQTHFLNDAIQGDQCLQVCLVLDGKAQKPQYFQLDEKHENPAEEIVRLVFNYLASLQDHKTLGPVIKAALLSGPQER